MLTLTASGAPEGEQLPPVDHLHDLDSSWEAVRRELGYLSMDTSVILPVRVSRLGRWGVY